MVHAVLWVLQRALATVGTTIMDFALHHLEHDKCGSSLVSNVWQFAHDVSNGVSLG
jgi:hypothetical protein